METTRFDAFARLVATRGTRRRLVQGLAALGFAGALAPTITDRSMAQPAAGSLPAAMLPPRLPLLRLQQGIAGGGLVRTADGREADFSLSASREPDPADPEGFLVVGHFLWADSAYVGGSLQMESTQIAGYGPTAGVEGGRDVSGLLRAQASGLDTAAPFFLQVVDGGPPGSGQDTVSLRVGEAVPANTVPEATPTASGFSYAFDGTLVSGDLAVLSVEAGGEAVPGTPGTTA